jgi:hypothetical protein
MLEEEKLSLALLLKTFFIALEVAYRMLGLEKSRFVSARPM